MGAQASAEACPQCQTPRRSQARFCHRCGHDFEPETRTGSDAGGAPGVKAPRRSRTALVPLLAVANLILVAVLAAVVSGQVRIGLVVFGVGLVVVLVLLLAMAGVLG